MLRPVAHLASTPRSQNNKQNQNNSNPFAVKYFLTIGDWAARVWNEDLRSPFLVGRCASLYELLLVFCVCL